MKYWLAIGATCANYNRKKRQKTLLVTSLKACPNIRFQSFSATPYRSHSAENVCLASWGVWDEMLRSCRA